jgi:hypothetical protein
MIKQYDPKTVKIWFNGIKFEGFIDGTFIESARGAELDALTSIIGQVRIIEPEVDRARYPKECPRCGAPAYIGASMVDCSKRCE